MSWRRLRSGLLVPIGGGAATYRYIRVNVTDHNAPAIVCFSICEFFFEGVRVSPINMTSNSVPSPNVISASSTFTGHNPWEAFEGNTGGNAWASNAAEPNWLKWDAGAGNANSVDRVDLAIGLAGSYNPIDWAVEGSNNDSDWTELSSYTGHTITDFGGGTDQVTTFSW